jgi:hypothetical protein
VHDFEIFKQSCIVWLSHILLLADKGFQGICEFHKFSFTPFKKPRNGQLTAEQKTLNRESSKVRIKIEHVNRRIKRFKILQMRYRNKQKKHLLRVALICGIYNYELGF